MHSEGIHVSVLNGGIINFIPRTLFPLVGFVNGSGIYFHVSSQVPSVILHDRIGSKLGCMCGGYPVARVGKHFIERIIRSFRLR